MKLWSYAGIMLTYRCNAKCRFCYYCCGPDGGGLLETETAINTWRSLRTLAGDRAKIHITGGEPFLYYDRLAELLTAANKAGLTPLDCLETNGYWADDETVVRERLEFLNACGLGRLKISRDVFHAEFIDCRPVQRLVRMAGQILGTDRVMVRWKQYLDGAITVSLADALRQDKCRFTGRAAGTLANLVPQKPADSFNGQNCRQAILSAKGVHIDPYGNVFSGQCSGICAGNIGKKTLEEIWENFDPTGMELWNVLFEQGPAGLLEQAELLGYKTLTGYASKCHLCYHLRRFFFDKDAFTPIIGPEDCYRD